MPSDGPTFCPLLVQYASRIRPDPIIAAPTCATASGANPRPDHDSFVSFPGLPGTKSPFTDTKFGNPSPPVYTCGGTNVGLSTMISKSFTVCPVKFRKSQFKKGSWKIVV
jgi:hypothetical protein